MTLEDLFCRFPGKPSKLGASTQRKPLPSANKERPCCRIKMSTTLQVKALGNRKTDLQSTAWYSKQRKPRSPFCRKRVDSEGLCFEKGNAKPTTSNHETMWLLSQQHILRFAGEVRKLARAEGQDSDTKAIFLFSEWGGSIPLSVLKKRSLVRGIPITPSQKKQSFGTNKPCS